LTARASARLRPARNPEQSRRLAGTRPDPVATGQYLALRHTGTGGNGYGYGFHGARAAARRHGGTALVRTVSAVRPAPGRDALAASTLERAVRDCGEPAAGLLARPLAS